MTDGVTRQSAEQAVALVVIVIGTAFPLAQEPPLFTTARNCWLFTASAKFSVVVVLLPRAVVQVPPLFVEVSQRSTLPVCPVSVRLPALLTLHSGSVPISVTEPATVGVGQAFTVKLLTAGVPSIHPGRAWLSPKPGHRQTSGSYRSTHLLGLLPARCRFGRQVF